MKDEHVKVVVAAILTVAAAYDSNPPDHVELADWITNLYWQVLEHLDKQLELER